MQNVIIDSGLDLQNFLMGSITPLLVAFLSKCSWPGWAKGLLCLAIAVAFATLQNLANFKLEDWVGSIFVVLTTAQVFYQAIWKQIGATDMLENTPPVKDPPIVLPTGINDPDNEAKLNK